MRERERDMQKDTKTAANVQQNQNCLGDKQNSLMPIRVSSASFETFFQQRKHKKSLESYWKFSQDLTTLEASPSTKLRCGQLSIVVP